MQPKHLVIRGINRYENVEIDLEQIPGNIIAICGPNGAGKTTLMESIFAALYRTFPSRPELIYEYCHGNSEIRLKFGFGGNDYESRLSLDPKRRRMEAYLYDGEKNSVSAVLDGKTQPFDRYIENVFGSSKLVLASSFAAQNKNGSFISLKKADRKALFINMLGQQRLEKLSKLASTYKADEEIILTRLESILESERSIAGRSCPDIDHINSRIDELQEEIRAAKELLDTATERYTVAASKATNAEELRNKFIELDKRNDSLTRDIRSYEYNIHEIEKEVASAESLKIVVQELHAEVEGQPPLRDELARLHNEQKEQFGLNKEYSEKVIASERRSSELKRALDLAEGELTRATEAADMLPTVPCQGEGEYGECKFLKSAVACRDNMEDLVGKVDESRAMALAAEQEIKSIPKPDPTILKSIEDRISKIKGEIRQSEAKSAELEKNRAKLIKAEQSSAKLTELKNSVERMTSDRELVLADLEHINSMIKEAVEAQALVHKTKTELENHRKDLKELQDQLATVQVALGSAKAEVKIIEKAQAEVQRLDPQYEQAAQNRKSYDLLSKAFGKFGIQSLEIDAAGPSVAGLVNDLLLSCFGPRFSIKLPTQRPKADGSFTDEFDIYAYDSEVEREGSIDDLSGGEQVVVAEAVSLAIALFNQQRSDVMWETLFRDEVSGALDDANAARYITMLRSARELGHFHKLFFIAHQPRIWDLADNRIVIKDQRLEIQ